jgi:hypothetical protein
VGNGVGDGDRNNGYGNKGGGQTMATMAMETATGNKTRNGSNKVAGNKEGNVIF